MYRIALTYLEQWAARERRKPLVIRGARQVGKSYLVRLLSETSFENLLEIDLEAEPSAAELFESRDPGRIVSLLELRFGTRIRAGATLLFLDEIQAAPQLMACLRYFYEKMPALHVIAAGSLLDFALEDPRFSMPVGRIEYLHLGPMLFEEYLLARGRDNYVDFIRGLSPTASTPETIHHRLMRYLREYLVVGGMPEVVAAFAASGSHQESEAVRQSILTTYRDDFAKYGRLIDRRRLEKVFARIPGMVGRKFKFSHVDREERSVELGRALELLCKARVAHKVVHTAANGIPLGAEADGRRFKVLFMDTGLVSRALGLNAVDIEGPEDVMLVNAGALCEHFVGQELLYSGESFAEPALYCWMRKKSQSSAEVDYVISIGQEVVPVEVKSGKTGALKSLHVFLQHKSRSFGLRFNSEPPSLFKARTSLPNSVSEPFRLLSLPLYLAGQTRRLCRACLDARS